MLMRAYPYSFKGALRATGEDAADFLQSQLSNDLRPFAEGQATYGLWLDVKGKVVADSWVICLGEEDFVILSQHCESALIQDKLEQHIIADDIELEELSAMRGLALVCDEVESCFDGFNGFAHLVSSRASTGSADLVFDSDLSRDDFMAKQDFSIMTTNEFHWERIAGGAPLVPVELGSTDLPGEGGLETNAISFTKGCFLGQEVVARMHNLGKPTRFLYKVGGEGAPPETPADVTSAGKVVGQIRSAYLAPDHSNSWFGVAMIKIRYADAELAYGGQGQPLSVENILGKGVNGE